MMGLIHQLPPGFLLRVLAGMAVNLQIATLALVFGLAVGVPLAFARLHHGLMGVLSSSLIGLMRAAPTFVVMFFLLYAIPRHLILFGTSVSVSGVTIVALSLLPYSAYFVAESGADALQQLRQGSPLTALLFLPNIARAFFVLVMASGSAAAIGVREAITTILREAERLPSIGERLALFAFGAVLFGIVLQTGLLLVNLLRGRLAVVAQRRLVLAATAEAAESYSHE